MSDSFGVADGNSEMDPCDEILLPMVFRIDPLIYLAAFALALYSSLSIVLYASIVS